MKLIVCVFPVLRYVENIESASDQRIKTVVKLYRIPRSFDNHTHCATKSFIKY